MNESKVEEMKSLAKFRLLWIPIRYCDGSIVVLSSKTRETHSPHLLLQYMLENHVYEQQYLRM